MLQIMLQPYVWAKQKPIVDFSAKQGIVIEGYSVLMSVDLAISSTISLIRLITHLFHLSPLTQYPGGPVDAPVKAIGARLKATDEQVLLAWAKAKGALPVT